MSTTNNNTEETIRELFEIKDGFYPSGEASTKRFAVWEIRHAINRARLEEQEKCKEISDKARQVGYANGYKEGKFDAEQDIDCAKTDSQ